MGSPETEPGRSSDEIEHPVRLSRAFFIGRHEVTQRQYAAVMDVNPSFYQGDPRLPVERVTWDGAEEFCRRASRLTGRAVRLPSEAQWEYACRAGTTTPFYFGGGVTPEQVNFDTSEGGAIPDDSLQRTTLVGQYPANRWGLSDTLGNVREWCADWYGPYPRDGRSVIDPVGPPTGPAHVLRGGSWDDYSRRCRSAYRYGYRPGDREQCNGFRVVVLIDVAAESK
jgi:formylglycine-generating enzyme required for sulfatase activity